MVVAGNEASGVKLGMECPVEGGLHAFRGGGVKGVVGWGALGALGGGGEGG